jgi:hypothetical protein
VKTIAYAYADGDGEFKQKMITWFETEPGPDVMTWQ